MAFADQISERNLGRRSWSSAPTPRGGRGTARRVVLPYGWLRRAAAIARASGAQRSVCASGCEEMSGNCGRDHPQRGHQPRTIPQSPSGRQLLLHKGAFGDGGCGSPRRFAPRNDSPDPLSFRGGPTGRRGNPSFFARDERRSSGRRVVVPYGWLRRVSAIALGSWRIAKRLRQRGRGRGGNRRGGASPKEDSHHDAKAALRARKESLVKFRGLPDDLFVQHGAGGSGV